MSSTHTTYISIDLVADTPSTAHEALRQRVDQLVSLLPDHSLRRVSPPLDYPHEDSRRYALALAFSGARVDAASLAGKLDTTVLGWRNDADSLLQTPDANVAARLDGFLAIALFHLQPTLRFTTGPTLRERVRALPFALPLWMGIVNVTPDSFSDGGRYQDAAAAAAQALALRDAGAHIIDVGAESTRPGAMPLDAEQEWARLAPALESMLDALGDDPLRPRLSVDTYHPQTAQRALAIGVDMINDVGGLTLPAMRELAASGDADWVAMHQLTLPANSDITLALNADPVAVVAGWFERQLDDWQRAGVRCERVMLDPGIGFGKRASQSLRLLREAATLADAAPRLLIGHSRKSFLGGFAPAATAPDAKDALTVGASLALCARPGVDALRVHNVAVHVNALRGWSQLQPSYF